jgi:hypothetical protein
MTREGEPREPTRLVDPISWIGSVAADVRVDWKLAHAHSDYDHEVAPGEAEEVPLDIEVKNQFLAWLADAAEKEPGSAPIRQFLRLLEVQARYDDEEAAEARQCQLLGLLSLAANLANNEEMLDSLRRFNLDE